MVRKRDRYTRAFAKRGRQKTKAPKTGWLIAELAALSGVNVRTLRYYVEQRLLKPSEFRGTATRYQRRELLRLFAILRLRSETALTLSEIRTRLDALSEAALESWLIERPLPPALATLLSASPPEVPTSHSADAATGALVGSLVESWQRIGLAAGLELMLRADASAEVRADAHRICADYWDRQRNKGQPSTQAPARTRSP